MRTPALGPPSRHRFAIPTCRLPIPGIRAVAAFGAPAHNRYALHIVNRGNQRSAVLTGLPGSVTAWRRFITDANRGMEDRGRVEARSGTGELVLPPASFTTLLGNHSP